MKRRREKGEDMYEKNKVKRGGFNNINKEKKKNKKEKICKRRIR